MWWNGVYIEGSPGLPPHYWPQRACRRPACQQPDAPRAGQWHLPVIGRLATQLTAGENSQGSPMSPMFHGEKRGFLLDVPFNQSSEIWWKFWQRKTSSISPPISNLSLEEHMFENRMYVMFTKLATLKGLLGENEPLTSSFKTLLTSIPCTTN